VITVAPTATAPSHRRHSPTPVAPRAAEAVSLSLTGLSKPLRTHHESTTVRLVDWRLRDGGEGGGTQGETRRSTRGEGAGEGREGAG